MEPFNSCYEALRRNVNQVHSHAEHGNDESLESWVKANNFRHFRHFKL